jgi:polysaccharide deacetylase 2 family uncharacterized protein YibQ
LIIRRGEEIVPTLEGGILVRHALSIVIVFVFLLTIPVGWVHATAADKRVVVIIDDFGNRMEGTKEILNLPIPITVAVMPFMPTTHEDAEHAFQKGDDVIVHLPMEPKHKTRGIGKGAITTDLSDGEIRKRVLAAIADVPHAIGINNHMGSKATGDPRVMKVILEVCKEKNLIFVDSKTNYWSVVPKVATQLRVPFVENHIFLDDSINPKKISMQCALIRKHLMHHDLCFAIGHVGRPGKETALVLEQEVPKIQRGATFIKLSSLFPPPIKQVQ